MNASSRTSAQVGGAADLDALAGSPVLDVKPYLVEFAPAPGHPPDS
ncbi:hypothetical protein [Streptosporangium sp. NPDC001681]